MGLRANERRLRNPITRNVRSQSFRYGRGILCSHARGHRGRAGKRAVRCQHRARNQKSKIRSNKSSGTLLAGQRRLLVGHVSLLPWLTRLAQRYFHANSSAITFAQYVMAVTAATNRFWQINEHQSGRFGPDNGSEMIRGDGHEKEFDPWRRDLACNHLVCARRWPRSHEPPWLSAPGLAHLNNSLSQHREF